MRIWRDDLPEVHRQIAARESGTSRTLEAPRPGEGLAGWALRMAQVAHEYGLAGVLARANCTWRGIAHLADSIPALAKTFSVDPEALRSAAYVFAANKRGWCRAFAGQRLGATALTCKFGRVCPACIRESGIIRQIWDLRLYTECPRHRASLIDCCPHCGKAIAWRRARAGLCDHCGGAYADARHSPAPADILPLVADIERVVGGEEPHLIPGFAEVIKPELRIQALLDTYILLGRAARRFYDLPSPAFTRSDIDDARRILRAAAVLLDGTWAPLHRFFAAVYVPPKESEQPDIRKMFPWLYEALFIRMRKYKDAAYNDVLAALQREFATYLSSAHPRLFQIVNINALVLKRVAETESRIGLQQAARNLGTRRTAVLRAADRLGIKIMQVRWSKGTAYVRPEDLGRIGAELVAHPDLVYGPRALNLASVYTKAVGRAGATGGGNPARRRNGRKPAPGSILLEIARKLESVADGRSFPRHDVCAGLKPALRLPVPVIARRLGLTPLTAFRLIRDGLFAEFEAEGKTAGTFLSVGAYAAFESALAARVAPAASKRRKLLVLNPRNLLVLRGYGVTLRMLLSAIQKGQLGAVHIHARARGVARLAVGREQLDAWMAQWRQARVPGYCDGRTAMMRLRVPDRDVVHHLRRKGYIRARTVNGRGEFYYDIADLDRFAREFVRPADLRLKRRFGTPTGKVLWAKAALRTQGVLPVIGPEIDGCSVTYYRRSDVEKAGLAAVPRAKSPKAKGRSPRRASRHRRCGRCRIG